MTANEFYDLLANISVLFPLVPFIVGLLNIKYIKKYLTPLFLLVIISIIVEILSSILIYYDMGNYSVLHFYTVLEFTMFIIFYMLFFKPYLNSFPLIYLIPFFLIVAFTDYKINGLENFDNFSAGTESIILSVLALFSFYYIIRNMLFENILSVPFFWINSGILLYFAGNMVLFIFNTYIDAYESESRNSVWMFHSFLNIFYYIVISIGLWKVRIL